MNGGSARRRSADLFGEGDVDFAGAVDVAVDRWREGSAREKFESQGREEGSQRLRDLSPSRGADDDGLEVNETRSAGAESTKRRRVQARVLRAGSLEDSSSRGVLLVARAKKVSAITAVGRALWGGALLLADFLAECWGELEASVLAEGSLCSKREIRVLELGSGVGLTAAVFAKLLARRSQARVLRVFLTDVDRGALRLCKMAVQLNADQSLPDALDLGASLQVYVRRFSWGGLAPWEKTDGDSCSSLKFRGIRDSRTRPQTGDPSFAERTQDEDGDEEECGGEGQEALDFKWSAAERQELSSERGLDVVLAADVDVFLEDFKDRFVCTVEQRRDFLFPDIEKAATFKAGSKRVSRSFKPRFHVYELPAELLPRRLFYDGVLSGEDELRNLGTTSLAGKKPCRASAGQTDFLGKEVENFSSAGLPPVDGMSESVFSMTPREVQDARRLPVIFEIRPCHCEEKAASTASTS